MLSAYLQQAEMESKGKSVTWAGEEIDYPTVPSIWRELGINDQHAFINIYTKVTMLFLWILSAQLKVLHLSKGTMRRLCLTFLHKLKR
jgi:glucose-6-phosphate isomerase